MEKPTVSTRMSPGSNPGWCTKGTLDLYGVSDNAIRKWIKSYEKDNS